MKTVYTLEQELDYNYYFVVSIFKSREKAIKKAIALLEQYLKVRGIQPIIINRNDKFHNGAISCTKFSANRSRLAFYVAEYGFEK